MRHLSTTELQSLHSVRMHLGIMPLLFVNRPGINGDDDFVDKSNGSRIHRKRKLSQWADWQQLNSEFRFEREHE